MKFFTSSIIFLTFIFLYAVFFIAPPLKTLGNLAKIALFHIPVAWVAVLAFFLSAFWSFRYLKTRNLRFDLKSYVAAKLGFIFTVLATLSGAIFAKLTWGSFWNFDPRQTTIFILLLLYGAYLILRLNSFDKVKRAKLASVYSLFSAITVPFLVFIIPRFYFSLHPSPLIQVGGKIDMDRIFLLVLVFALFYTTLLFFYLFKRMVQRNSLS